MIKQTSIQGGKWGGRMGSKKEKALIPSEFEISLHFTISKSDLNCRKSNMCTRGDQ